MGLSAPPIAPTSGAAATAEPLTEGMCLSGRFRLERCIGVGGMGVVWSATNTNTLRRVALKVLKAETATDKRVRRRFLREARAASAVRHPNVVEILDVVELDDGSPAMVMELLEGESLSTRLRRLKKLDVATACSLMLPVIAAVGAAHAVGIVHRDLKPDNIFLARTDDGVLVKVLDFGIAKVSALDHEAGGQTEALTGTGTMLGTPYYMSPEQVFADAVIDYRSDIWALGVVLYQCLSGTRPTQAENVGQIMKIIMSGSMVPLAKVEPELPPEITDLVTSMLSFHREARPQSCREICDVLKAHSDVKVATFGDPVFVNVVTLPESSGDLGAAVAAEGGSDATRTEDTNKTEKISTADLALAAANVSKITEAFSYKDATLTESKLGVSMSGVPASSINPTTSAKRSLVTIGGSIALAVVAIAGTVVVLNARSHPPTTTSSQASPPPPPVVETQLVPSAVITAAPTPSVAPPSSTPSASVVTTRKVPAKVIATPSKPTAATATASAAPRLWEVLLRSLRSKALAFALLAFGVFQRGVASAEDAVAEAREEFVRGTDAGKRAQWSEALVFFEHSAKLRPHAVTTFNVGVCQRALGQYHARTRYTRACDHPKRSGERQRNGRHAGCRRSRVRRADRRASRRSARDDRAKIRHDRGRRPPTRSPTRQRRRRHARRRTRGGRGEEAPAKNFRLVLNPGAHVVTLSRPGFADAVISRTMTPGSKPDLKIELDRLPALIHITSNQAGAVVMFDDHDVGAVPVDISRPAGMYRVSVSKSGFNAYQAKINVTPGQDLSLAAPLAKHETSILGRWWFWTIAGAVLVGAGVTTYALTRQDPAPIQQPLNSGGLGWAVQLH